MFPLTLLLGSPKPARKRPLPELAVVPPLLAAPPTTTQSKGRLAMPTNGAGISSEIRFRAHTGVCLKPGPSNTKPLDAPRTEFPINVLSEVDFGALTETQIEPIYEGWLKLPCDARKEMEQDFQDIDELATEGGSKAILDEARWHGEDLAEQFASLKGFHEHAFWRFLERPKYWPGALAFHHADAVPFSYWRKRKNRISALFRRSIAGLRRRLSLACSA
jgi:hypothetical protein